MKNQSIRESIIDNIGNDIHKAISDIGSLKIGNDNFALFIPNGYGDGFTIYAVYDSEPAWIDLMNFCNSEYFEVKNDNAYVYNYDCGNAHDVCLLPGRYRAYYYDGIVVIYRCRG